MLDLNKEYNTDYKKELEGVWEPVGGDAELLIAAWGNPAFDKKFSNQPRQVRSRINRGKLSDAEDREIMIQIVVDTILLDWKNLTELGKTIKHTRENAVKMLTKYPKFYRDVVTLSTDESRYQSDDEEENEKNS